MIKLASYDNCTGCGVCSFVCNNSAISMLPNHIGVVVPNIDEDKCIECGRCQKVCPAIHEVEFHKPEKAYAAWHNTTSERVTSASGAIASAAYQLALENGWDIAGAVQNPDFSVDVVVSNKLPYICLFKNSKYVYSSIKKLLPQLSFNIKERKKTLVIALPCQIAAIRKCFPNQNDLILADVVCHGSTPYSYLQQHIRCIEAQNGKRAKEMSFRDPAFQTLTYTFTLYDENGECFYAKRTKDGDTYQYGYHRAVSYRENCFHCPYARPDRVGDFTLCDYSSLGKKYPFEYNHINCSCVLANTMQGAQFLKSLIEKQYITAIERPLDEPIKGNRQLRSSCKKSMARIDFENAINQFDGDFEKAIAQVIKRSNYYKTLSIIQSIPNKAIIVFNRILCKIKNRKS